MCSAHVPGQDDEVREPAGQRERHARRCGHCVNVDTRAVKATARHFLATLKNLPPRTGQRATVAPFAIPHRQIDQHNTEAFRQRQKAILDEVVKQHATDVKFQTSFFETHNQAVFLKLPTNGNSLAVPDTHGEVGHIHPTDGSMHFSLSPSDTVEVLAKGWGELHGLAGQVYAPGRRLPATYTIIYSPRTDSELAVAQQIIDAAIRFSALEN